MLPTKSLNSRLCLHQRHAGGLVVVGVDGWNHLAADWVEDGQRRERPGDFPVLWHAPQLLGGLLDGAVVNQLDAGGGEKQWICIAARFCVMGRGLSHQSLSDVHSSLCMHKQNYNIQPHLLLFFFSFLGFVFHLFELNFRCNAEYIVLIILQLVITFFSAAHWMNGCQCQRTYERMNGHETAMNDNINDQNCKPKTEGEGTEIKFKRRTQER